MYLSKEITIDLDRVWTHFLSIKIIELKPCKDQQLLTQKTKLSFSLCLFLFF